MFENWFEDLYARDATGTLITHDSKGNFIVRDANNAVIDLVAPKQPEKPVEQIKPTESEQLIYSVPVKTKEK
jgi:hypothetical protein